MNSQAAPLPEVLVWIQAMSVPILGCLAAWIAYQQWKTADRKVQLDLFDRRYDVYTKSKDALVPIMREGGASFEDITSFRVGYDKAGFLFGKEVVAEFDSISEAIGKLAVHTAGMKNGPPYEQKDITGRRDNMLRVSDFYIIMPLLIDPYMKLDNKSQSFMARVYSRLRLFRIRAEVGRRRDAD